MADAAIHPVGSPQGNLQTWRELYTAALFETDTNRIPERIAAAERAIVARARELFAATSDTIEEDQALDDALYALGASELSADSNRSRLKRWQPLTAIP
jgi:hypothetical protein